MHKAKHRGVLFLLAVLSVFLVSTLSPIQAHADEWGSDLKYQGKTFKKEWVNTILPLCRQYKILPSLILSQAWLETNWGQVETITYFETDNNMSGITWVPGYTGAPGANPSKGSPRPSNEGGNYIRYPSVNHYLKDYVYLLRKGNIYNVAEISDLREAAKGLFKVGGAKYDYAASGASGYVELLPQFRDALNKANDNAITKLDKMVVDGSTWKTESGTSDKEVEEAPKPTAQTLDPHIDHTFQVNMYNLALGRDWDESDIEAPTSNEFQKSISSKQRSQLNDWIAEYNNAKVLSMIGMIRVTVQTIGILLIFLSIALLFAYLADRLGVLDFSVLHALTGGKLSTAYEAKDQTFFSSKQPGTKFVAFSGLASLCGIIFVLAILIFTGKIYTLVYEVSVFVADMVNYILSYLL